MTKAAHRNITGGNSLPLAELSALLSLNGAISLPRQSVIDLREQLDSQAEALLALPSVLSAILASDGNMATQLVSGIETLIVNMLAPIQRLQEDFAQLIAESDIRGPDA